METEEERLISKVKSLRRRMQKKQLTGWDIDTDMMASLELSKTLARLETLESTADASSAASMTSEQGSAPTNSGSSEESTPVAGTTRDRVLSYEGDGEASSDQRAGRSEGSEELMCAPTKRTSPSELGDTSDEQGSRTSDGAPVVAPHRTGKVGKGEARCGGIK
jgi:hypothetical protein